eukprot:209961-Chlamydomonas_euryale.AAC.1
MHPIEPPAAPNQLFMHPIEPSAAQTRREAPSHAFSTEYKAELKTSAPFPPPPLPFPPPPLACTGRKARARP